MGFFFFSDNLFFFIRMNQLCMQLDLSRIKAHFTFYANLWILKSSWFIFYKYITSWLCIFVSFAYTSFRIPMFMFSKIPKCMNFSINLILTADKRERGG